MRKVSVVMGSTSDLETMKKAINKPLKDFGIYVIGQSPFLDYCIYSNPVSETCVSMLMIIHKIEPKLLCHQT